MKDHTGGVCTAHAEDGERMQNFWFGSMKVRVPSQDLDVDGRIILRCLEGKQG